MLNSRPASGFSLIEVLVAVLLFSLLALSIGASSTNLLRVDSALTGIM